MRNHFLLHYIESGSGVAGTSQSDARQLEQGQCFLYPPHSMMYYRASAENPWCYRWLAFSAGPRQRLLSVPGSSSPVCFYTTVSDGILPLITDIIKLLKKQKKEASATSEKLLLQLFSILINKTDDPFTLKNPTETENRSQERADYVKEARDYIGQNYQISINSKNVADYIGLDRSYFSRMFTEETGMTLRDYIINIRMKEACRLLEHSEYTIQAIASSVGYRDYAVFSRRFKAVTGVSAGEWRQLSCKK